LCSSLSFFLSFSFFFFFFFFLKQKKAPLAELSFQRFAPPITFSLGFPVFASKSCKLTMSAAMKKTKKKRKQKKKKKKKKKKQQNPPESGRIFNSLLVDIVAVAPSNRN
jgi:hypothetical protein